MKYEIYEVQLILISVHFIIQVMNIIHCFDIQIHINQFQEISLFSKFAFLLEPFLPKLYHLSIHFLLDFFIIARQ
jgi:hypothetical protein